MSPEQLIGTIQQVNSHKEDSREDPWKTAGEQWAGIGATLRDHYQELVGERGPSQDQVSEALRTLGTAAAFLSESVGQALRDPATKTRLKTATAGLLSAVGRTISDLAKEFAAEQEETE